MPNEDIKAKIVLQDNTEDYRKHGETNHQENNDTVFTLIPENASNLRQCYLKVPIA